MLIVDDETDIATAMRVFLEGTLDVAVEVARSSRAALELLDAKRFDLVLTDFRMPGMTGLEFLRRIQEGWPSLPRILMTAYPDVRLALDALNQGGISRFLVKPVDPDQLAREVVALTGASAHAA